MRPLRDFETKKQIKKLLIEGYKILDIAKQLKVSTGLINTVKFNRKNSTADKNTDFEMVLFEERLTGVKVDNKHITNNYNTIIDNGLIPHALPHRTAGNLVKHINIPSKIVCNSIMDILSINTNINTTNNIPSSPLAERSDAETIQEKTEKENILNIKQNLKNQLEVVVETAKRGLRNIRRDLKVDCYEYHQIAM